MMTTAVDTVTPTVVACGGDDGRDGGGGDSDGGELGGMWAVAVAQNMGAYWLFKEGV